MKNIKHLAKTAGKLWLARSLLLVLGSCTQYDVNTKSHLDNYGIIPQYQNETTPQEYSSIKWSPSRDERIF